MARRAVEVRECDRCGREPANSWRITGPDGLLREIELCEQHGAPVANAYALARPMSAVGPRAGRGRTRTRPPEKEPDIVPEPEPIWR